jgi:hypothetical protein
MPQKTRPQQSSGNSDHHKQSRAPGWLWRKPIGRKQCANFAPQPSPFFLAVQCIFKTGATACQQCRIGFHSMLSKECQQLSLSVERGRATAALREMTGKLALLNGVELIACRQEHQQRLPFTALLACTIVQTRISALPHPLNPSNLA